ncbi:MAG: carbohydrate ABC transporter permease [Treponemataceae bacterium]
MRKKLFGFSYCLGAFIILFIYIFPLYWLFANSLKTNVEIFKNPPTLWPIQPIVENYIAIFNSEFSNVYQSFGNSLYIAVYTTIFTIALALPAAYALATFKIKFGQLFILIFIIGQMLSQTVKLVPLFMIFRSMNLINTFASVIISICTFTVPFAILIMRPFFLAIPSEINESAKMDGCNIYTAFIRVILPISYPSVVVVAVFTFLLGWGDLVYPLTFLTDFRKRPMIANISSYVTEFSTSWNLLLAFAVVSIVPVVVIFFLMQKYIVGGLTLGSVKG